MRFLLGILIILTTTLVCDAQCTTRKGLKPKKVIVVDSTASVVVDTLKNADTHIVEISGYDKPLSSHHETFFATNKSKATIKSIGITFNYFDRKNRQLHSAKVTIDCSIPPGETRLLSIKSWDKQNSFYYYRSAKPRRQATPYSVTHSIYFVVTTK